jgi:hypothetical protein
MTACHLGFTGRSRYIRTGYRRISGFSKQTLSTPVAECGPFRHWCPVNRSAQRISSVFVAFQIHQRAARKRVTLPPVRSHSDGCFTRTERLIGAASLQERFALRYYSVIAQRGLRTGTGMCVSSERHCRQENRQHGAKRSRRQPHIAYSSAEMVNPWETEGKVLIRMDRGEPGRSANALLSGFDLHRLLFCRIEL